MTISLAETPSLVTLVCATAGSGISESAPSARPSAISDFDIQRLLFPDPFFGPCRAKGGPSIPSPLSFPFRSGYRAFAIHGVDLGRVALVHETPLELHGRRQLFIFGRELTLDQIEFLDSLDAREIGIDCFDLAPDQILNLGRAAQARIIGEGDVVILGELLDILLIDHDKAGEIRPL